MPLLAILDWTAERLRAWSARDEGEPVRPVALDGTHFDLPLAISLEKRAPQLGRSALQICRVSPHVVCQDFLPRLGELQHWRHGRHNLDSAAACRLILQRVRDRLGLARTVLNIVPTYLSPEQTGLLEFLAREADLKVLGSIRRGLALGLAAYGDNALPHPGVVVDTDDFAFSCTALEATSQEVKQLRVSFTADSGLRHWRERLLDHVANRCILQNRRDPRARPEADQLLFDQSERMLDAVGQGRAATLNVQAGKWVQPLEVTAEAAAAVCRGFAQAGARMATETLRGVAAAAGDQSIFLTTDAARLPGLVSALYDHSGNQIPVVLLKPDALGGLCDLAQRLAQGLVPTVHWHSTSIPFPNAPPPAPPQIDAPPLVHSTQEDDDDPWRLPFPTQLEMEDYGPNTDIVGG